MQPVWLCILWSRQFEETFENPWWRKEKQMQSLWLCIPFAKEFEESFRNALWRKVKQMQPLRLCIDSGKQFEDTFENAQWTKVKQMQPVWLCILIYKCFEEAFENPQWRKVKQMQPVWLCIHYGKQFEDTFENSQRRKIEQMDETPYWLYPCILIPQGHSPPRVGVGDVSFEVTSCCDHVKKNSHCMQVKGFSPECVSLCFLRSPFVVHLYSHYWQLNGFTPVWNRMWMFRWEVAVNEEAHIGRLWVSLSSLLCFSLECETYCTKFCICWHFS